ncbi:MAG: CDP-alcohol phosphatidyltransferase family protein [Gemmatimonadales bacterium]
MPSSPLGFVHWSNLLSYASAGSWLMAVHSAVVGRSWAGAGSWIALAALADMFDGKFASLFLRSRHQREFGIQLDSLVDAVAFGGGPVACLIALTSPGTPAEGGAFLLAALVYLTAALTRLGYFNLESHADQGFVGVPTTIVGLLWSSLFFLEPSPNVATGGLLFTAALMLLPVSITRPTGWRFALFPAWAVGLVVLGLL